MDLKKTKNLQKKMYKKGIKKYPKISIITVCLNSEKTINKCLESVIGQNYPKKKN